MTNDRMVLGMDPRIGTRNTITIYDRSKRARRAGYVYDRIFARDYPVVRHSHEYPTVHEYRVLIRPLDDSQLKSVKRSCIFSI